MKIFQKTHFKGQKMRFLENFQNRPSKFSCVLGTLKGVQNAPKHRSTGPKPPRRAGTGPKCALGRWQPTGAPRAPATAGRAFARPARGGAVPSRPKGTCLAAGSHGGARAGSGRIALWRARTHSPTSAHVRRAGPLCKLSAPAPGSLRSLGGPIGPLGCQRAPVGSHAITQNTPCAP